MPDPSLGLWLAAALPVAVLLASVLWGRVSSRTAALQMPDREVRLLALARSPANAVALTFVSNHWSITVRSKGSSLSVAVGCSPARASCCRRRSHPIERK